MLRPGTLIGIKYQIEHLIAEGGMAEVYLARSIGKRSAHAYVAIKRLKPGVAQVESLAELFVKEAQLIINIRNAHIVKGLELLRESGELLLVMEFILGHEVGQLSLMLKKHELQARTEVALAVGLGVAKALQCIRDWPNDQGTPLSLIHGDISPQNIIISTEGVVKLVDFGVAMSTVHQNGNDKELLRGNIRYMSPEQRAGHPLTQSSDLYSLAIVLREIIASEHPKSPLHPILAKAQIVKREQRYQLATDFLQDLEALSTRFAPFEPRQILRQALQYQSLANKRRRHGSFVPVLAIVLALMLILSLVVAGGVQYFSPEIPTNAIDDHHCANYHEDLGQHQRAAGLSIFNEENP